MTPAFSPASPGRLLEELERPLELALALERVAHVVVELGVVAVDAQSGREDGVLVTPVDVAPVRLQPVRQNQHGQSGVQNAPVPSDETETAQSEAAARSVINFVDEGHGVQLGSFVRCYAMTLYICYGDKTCHHLLIPS